MAPKLNPYLHYRNYVVHRFLTRFPIESDVFMKKAIIILIVVFFSSCSNTNKNEIYSRPDLLDSIDYIFETDVNPNFMISGNSFCKSDDAYYCVTPYEYGYRIISYNIETSKSSILCSKHECMHIDETCNAFSYPTVSGMSIYENKLIWVATDPEHLDKVNIFSLNLDGTERKVIKTLSSRILDDLNDSVYVKVHRGYMYFGGVCINDDGISVKIIAEELSKNGKSMNLLSMSNVQGYPILDVQILENKIYASVSIANIDDHGKFSYDYELYSWETEQYNMETLYSGYSPIFIWDTWIVPNDVVYLSGFNHDNSVRPNVVYKYNFTSNKFEFLFDYSNDKEEYSYPYFADNKVIATTTDKSWISIKDFDGNTLNQNNYKKIENEIVEEQGWLSRAFVGADDDYIYYNYCTGAYYVALPISNSKPAIIWRI